MNHQERERVHQTSCHHIARDRESPHLWQKWGTRGRGTSLDMKHNPVPLGAAHRGHILVTPLHRSAGACSQRTFLSCYRAQGGLQLKPQRSTKTTLGQLHKRSLEGRFLCSDFECFPLLIHSGQALYEFTRQRLQPALSPCFHIFVRAPSCLRRQDGPKPHLKSEGLVHKHKAT